MWGASRHKLSWWTLKCPTNLGSTAVPDLTLFNVASQLSYFSISIKTIRTGVPPLCALETLNQQSILFQIFAAALVQRPMRATGVACCFITVKFDSWLCIIQKHLNSVLICPCGAICSYLSYSQYQIIKSGLITGSFYSHMFWVISGHIGWVWITESHVLPLLSTLSCALCPILGLHPQPWITILNRVDHSSGPQEVYFHFLQPLNVTCCHGPGLPTEIPLGGGFGCNSGCVREIVSGNRLWKYWQSGQQKKWAP